MLKNTLSFLFSALLLYAPVTLVADASESSFTIPDIYGNVPVERVKSEVLWEWPRFTFLESVLSYPEHGILVTDHLQGILYRLQDGAVENVLDIDGELLCLSAIRGDSEHFMATAWVKKDGKNEGVLLKVSQDGSYETLANFPEESFLNGITQMDDGRFLMAGSATGNIWFYDPASGKSGIWHQGELTKGQNGIPGINGIKVLRDTVYFSNTGKFLTGTIKIKADGSAGKAELHTENTLLDDFAIDKDGTIYGATHKDEILKINPDGTKTVIAQYDQGVTGSTSVSWDQTQTDKKALLVATNGGINHRLFGKGKSSVVPAKVVRLTLE